MSRKGIGALFRPPELESPGTHLVLRDLNRVGEVFRRASPELGFWAGKLGVTLVAMKYLMILVCSPRPTGRKLGVGVQVSTPALARRFGVSESTVHRARRQLQSRGLLKTIKPIRSVKALTKNRRPHLRMRSFVAVHGVGDKARLKTHYRANTISVDYPLPRAFTLLDAHDPRRPVPNGRRRRQPETRKRVADDESGLWMTLWRVLKASCARLVPPAKAPSESDTPCNTRSNPFYESIADHRRSSPKLVENPKEESPAATDTS